MNAIMKTRDNYVDFLRGIAVLCIISIHSAFWAGQSYTPQWFWNITLLVDVPFFFYLSGWASGYRKSNLVKSGRGLLEIWYKWIFFVIALEIVCQLSQTQLFPISFEGISDIPDLINNIMFNVSFPGFPVVAGSIWFMQYYFVVIIVNVTVMMFIEKGSDCQSGKRFYMYFLILAFLWVYYGKYALGLDLSYILFYSAFWMMGMNKFGKVNTLRKLMLSFAAITFGIVLCSHLQTLPLWDLQSAKFPPSLKYGFASMYAIILATYFDGKYHFQSRILAHIGRNAIFYYFAQGVGSSLNYYVVDALYITPWFPKWFLTLLINILITSVIAETLAAVYKCIQKAFCALFDTVKGGE